MHVIVWVQDVLICMSWNAGRWCIYSSSNWCAGMASTAYIQLFVQMLIKAKVRSQHDCISACAYIRYWCVIDVTYVARRLLCGMWLLDRCKCDLACMHTQRSRLCHSSCSAHRKHGLFKCVVGDVHTYMNDSLSDEAGCRWSCYCSYLPAYHLDYNFPWWWQANYSSSRLP